jgi:sugar lactone lactonase YvrE
MQGMAIDAAGNLFFTQSQAQTTGSTYEPVSNQIATSEDTTASLVFKLAPDGKFTRVAGGKAGNKDGPVASAQFGAGGDIVVDSKGNLFFLDLDNGLLREITSDGRVVTLANTKSTLLRIDRSDNLYFLVDNYVWKQDPAGQIYKIAGTGKLGRTDGPGTTASFSQTQDLVVDGNGTIYVSEDWFDGKKFAIRVISRGG